MSDAELTLQAIEQRAKKMGDLPIFSASINRIREVSSNPDSNAMALSKEATKDANLSAKLLRLANSSYYNRGSGKIGVVSRAVVILGFSTIKNLCLSIKLVDSFQHEHPSIDMNKLLVNAYTTAGFVREIAMQCGVKDIEDSFTCALMHNLGEIAVAYFLPEKYLQIKELHKEQDLDWKEAELNILGISIKDIGQHLANGWEFPSTIVKTMEPYQYEENDVLHSGVQLNRALSSLATNVVSTLYNHNKNKKPFPDQLTQLAEAVGLKPEAIEESLIKSFKMSCDLANAYGLEQDRLMPEMDNTGDELRDRMASRLAFYASNKTTGSRILPLQNDADDTRHTQTSKDTSGPPHPANTATARGDTAVTLPNEPVNETPASDNAVNQHVQLEVLQEITQLITNNASLNMIFTKVLEGIQRGSGFDRALLCLLSPNHQQYTARIASGHSVDQLKASLQNITIDIEHDIFSRTIIGGTEQVVDNIQDSHWRMLLPDGFAATSGAQSFIIASIIMNEKPLGLFYADKITRDSIISQDEHRTFMQFISQARLALQINSQK
ncbi:MAG: HDOD domain-containing protein [Gammaproteobacteria bacterium]